MKLAVLLILAVACAATAQIVNSSKNVTVHVVWSNHLVGGAMLTTAMGVHCAHASRPHAALPAPINPLPSILSRMWGLPTWTTVCSTSTLMLHCRVR